MHIFEQEDGYSEYLFCCLGAKEVNSFDYSDYEGATQILDMNILIPEKFRNKYSFIYDGGTFIIETLVNNENCHGLYQFSAELLIDILSSNGFQIQDISLDIRTTDSFTHRMYRLGNGLYPYELANLKSSGTYIRICAKKIGNISDEIVCRFTA